MAIYTDINAAKADGVIHYWSFSDYTNNVFKDHAGTWDAEAVNPNGHVVSDAIVSGANGGLNTGHFYDGTDAEDYIRAVLPVASPSNQEFADYTIKFRFTFAGASEAGHFYHDSAFLCLGGHIDVSPNEVGALCLAKYSDDDLELYAEVNNLSPDWIQPAGIFTAGKVFNVTLRSIAGELSLFYEDVKNSFVLSASYIQTNSIVSSFLRLYSHPAYIGFDKYNDLARGYFNGIIGDLVIWDRGLSDAEIQGHYDTGQALAIVDVLEQPEAPEVVPVPRIKTKYFSAVLTGEANSTTDLELKISSFNGRKRSGRDSYLSIVLPGTQQIEADIIARSDGEIVLKALINDVESELLRVNYADLRVDRGPKSRTLTLSGTKQSTNASPVTVELEDCLYFRNQITSTSLRFPITPDVNPADTVTFESTNYLIDTISYIGSINSGYMELKT